MVVQLMSKLSEKEQRKLFSLIIGIIDGKKEVLKLRKREETDMPKAKGGKKGRG